jgi:hypothetical protein
VNWTFMLKKSEIAYLTLVMVIVLLLPLLELLGRPRQLTAKLTATLASPDTREHSALGAATATARAAVITKTSSAAAHYSRRKSWIKLVWPFPRLSTTAALFVAAFLVFTLLTIIVPLATLSREDLKAPMFIGSYLMVMISFHLRTLIYLIVAITVHAMLYTFEHPS